jgi:hypothetical protein
MGCCDGAKKIVKGAMGLTKAALAIDQVSDGEKLRRRDICRDCPQATRNQHRLHLSTKGLTACSMCKVCSCNIKAKTSLVTEHCPESKW